MYLEIETFSSLSNIFNHITVNTGAELIIKVTKPEEMYWSEKTKDQPTKNIDEKLVSEASFNSFLLNFSLLKMR